MCAVFRSGRPAGQWHQSFSHRQQHFALAASVVIGELFAKCEAKPPSEEERNASTKTAIAVLCLLFILCGSGITWCLYLECRPETWRTRLVMFIVVLVATTAELGLCAWQVFHWWMFPAILLFNTWGPLDAVMRFPVVHGFDTVFSVKQILVMLAKILCYIFGIQRFSQNRIAFFAMLMLNVIGMPLMYVLALPLDEGACEQAGAARGVVDVDVAIRLVRVVSNPKDRRECALDCKRRARVVAAGVAHVSPTAGRLLCRLDPQLQRVVHKSGRDV